MKIDGSRRIKSSNFRYLLSTQQQQVVDSAEVPLLPSFHKFSTVYFALQNKCAPPIYRSANKGSQGEKRKIENLARTFRLLRWNIPDGPGKAGSILDEGNFQIPSGGLANETVRTKRYSVLTFEREYLAENQEFDRFGWMCNLIKNFIISSNYDICVLKCMFRPSF